MKRILLAAAMLFGGATTVQANPTISDIGGVTQTDAGVTNGRADMSIGPNFNGKLVVNDEPGKFTWTIRGSGFGTTSGTVTLYGRTVPVISGGWTNTAIKVNVSGAQINPARPWDWAPLSTTLTVKTAAGQTANKGVEIIPAIKTRVFGQCTHQVALRRYQMGMLPSPTAYGGYTGITAAWVPARGNQLQWPVGSGKHTGIIESVRSATANGVTTYTVTLSQRNARGNNEYNEFSTTFSVRGGSVLTTPRFSNSSSQATSFYR